MALRIFDYSISRRGIVNEVKLQKQQDENDIIKKIHKITLTRIAKQIKDWQTGTLVAESVVAPLNWLLIAVYRDIEVDAHTFALMQTIIIKVLSNNFVWVTQKKSTDPSGKPVTLDVVDEEVTAKFKKKWFRKFMINTVNSKFYGFSLNQFGNLVDGVFEDCTLVPRDYVNQRLGIVQTVLSSSKDGIPFTAPPFNKWVLGIGDVDDLGLLHKAAPLIIKKKEVISAWSEAAEVFGMPIRIGKTNISSPKNKENMDDMLENIGSAAWASIDKEDDIVFAQVTKTDFFKIYNMFIDMANSELSKLFLLQTGTTDEKSFTGSANVHNDLLTDMINSVIVFMEETVNEKLKPLCKTHGMVTEDHTFKTLNDQKLSMEDTIAALVILLQFYDLPAAWINEKFDIPVEKKEEVDPTEPVKTKSPGVGITLPKANAAETYATIKALYENFFTGKHTHKHRAKK